MPVIPFIPLIAAGIGAGSSAIMQHSATNTREKEIAAQQAFATAHPELAGTIGGSDPLSVLMEQQRKIAETTAAGAQQDITSARGKLEESNNLYNAIVHGTPDEVMQYLDAGGATRQTDENAQISQYLGNRGGTRAAVTGNANFARDAALNNLLKQFKFAAIPQMTDIGKAFANLGTSEYAAANAASGQATNALLTQSQIDAQRSAAKSGLIGSILGTAGSVAGVVLAKKLKSSNPVGTVYTNTGSAGGNLGNIGDIFANGIDDAAAAGSSGGLGDVWGENPFGGT